MNRLVQWVLGLGIRAGDEVARRVAGPIALVLAAVVRPRRRELVWSPTPIINNKYWSQAMRRAGWESLTLMTHHYPANNRADYDRYLPDLVPAALRRYRDTLAPYAGLLYILRNASVVHIPFTGGPLGATRFWRLEAHLLRRAGVRSVVIPYGGDYFQYSQIIDPVFRNGLLISYPAAGRREAAVARRVQYWCRHADIVIGAGHLDGLSRWDVPAGNVLCIDTERWPVREVYSGADGRSGTVRVMHAPNHRGVKGTEFLLDAVELLRAEGLDVELVLVEGQSNNAVRSAMAEVDVFADQFILTGYGLAAVEAMSCGLPVMCNLEDEYVMRIFRLYSFFGECPIVSAPPELLVNRLRLLVTRPDLRRELGEAGRRYVERYHSEATAQFLFGSIYRKLLDGEDVDLMNLLHPLRSSYVQAGPRIAVPALHGSGDVA
jgi:glycosyltransferase involved in cell wall biosynthesis